MKIFGAALVVSVILVLAAVALDDPIFILVAGAIGGFGMGYVVGDNKPAYVR